MPDLCRLPRLAALLGLAELVVVVLVLAPDDARTWTLARFLSASGLALWLALAVAVLLCKLRAPISRLPQRVGAAAAVALAALVAFVGAGVIHALYSALGAEPLGVDFGRFAGGSAAVAALIVALALRHFYVSDRWAVQIEANARAEADALQARIRPHFLFNSMNLIASLLRRDPAVAERAVLDLSDLFRAALGAGEGESTLAAECELAAQYLSIEQLRLGERLRVEWDKREPLPWELPLPRLVLQPLVENAVLHGISRLPEGGTVSIALWSDAAGLHVRVRNPAPAPQDPSLASLHRGAGHAQRSIAHRLAWRFGPQARVTAGWADGYYACEVMLPLA
ncbi:sensor histidine kinase [Pseudoxanthomonas suwonensis]|uniref:Histidine kinase n=1 Tax=Pseudoxanthomonas suwonensis TaxID=314722 RepID=A0A0E3Z4Z5_9GAMM|nr:histidine kinase [Pseudoxanthomonas suwonensis]AKC88234.1 histidine kinase [Pseudoxanthomonas suwonensis]